MAKLIGYAEMKKTEGKICFVTEEGKSPVVGQSCEKVFLFGCGYNGKAFVADVTVR